MTQISPQQNSSSHQPIQWFKKVPPSPESILAEKDNISLFSGSHAPAWEPIHDAPASFLFKEAVCVTSVIQMINN